MQRYIGSHGMRGAFVSKRIFIISIILLYTSAHVHTAWILHKVLVYMIR